MSSLVEMKMQGVRSFGPDEPQEITFYNPRNLSNAASPLTLIVGANGTGKTTVVECLKYMTTEKFPPGSSKRSFVHDPKISSERKIEGKINLVFKDINGTEWQVRRNMEVEKKFKTLECDLRKYAAEGDDAEDIYSKPADLNTQIPSLLGVSRALLENVIFCHQEDSSWPLGEGQAVKQRFDNIFGISRFGDLLEAVREARKKKQKEIDDFKKDVEHYRTLKEKVAEIKEEVENLESELAAAEVSISQKDEDVNKLSVHMNEIEGKEKRIKDLQREIESLGIKKTALENTLYNLQQNIQTFFTGSRDELEQQLNDFKQTVEEKELELQKVEEDLSQTEVKLKQCNEEKPIVLLKHGQLEQEQKQHQDNVTKRNEAAKEFASQYGISDFQQEMTDSNIEDFQREMKKKCDEFQESCRKKKEEFDVKEQDIRGKENEAWEEKTKMETELRSKQKTMKEQEAEIREITVKLREVATSEDTLNTVQNDLSKAKKDLEKERESASTEELNEELKVMIKEKSEFEKKFKNLQCELEELRKDSKVQTELDIYQKDKSNKQDQIRELRNKNEDSLKRLLRLPEMPTENLDKTLQDFLKQQNSDIKHINKQLENKKKSLYSLEFDRKNVIRQREEKEQELDEYNKQFLNTCNGIENFNDALKQIQRKIEDLSLTQGTSRVWKEYIEKLKKENAPCPLCKRKFDNQSAIQELVDDLETEIKNLPYIRNVNTEILENQEKYKKLQQLEPFLANVEDLGKKKLPDLKDEQQSIEEQLRKIESGILELTENLEKKQDDVTSASSLQPDLRSIDGYNEGIHELDRRIISLREKLTASTISSNGSEQQVYSEWQEIQTIIEKKNNEIESKRCEIKDHNDRRNNLSASINQLQSQALAFEKDVLPKLNLEEKKTQLLQQNESLSVEIQKTELDIKPVKEKINKYAAERNYAISERDKLCKQLDDKYKNCENDRKEINFLDDAIKSYWNRGSAKDLEENTIKMQKINEEAEKLESDQKSKIMSISTMQKILNSQEMKKRELRDNLTYKENQEECQKIEENIQKLEMDLEGLKVFSVDSKKKELDDECERLKNEKYRLQGTVGGLESEIQKKQDELTSALYKDAEEKFVENIVKLKTTEVVCADLHKYYRAVDRALRSYHEEKIREVNDRIQDLWRETYRGTDIEMIEIDAGEEAALPDPSDMEQKRRNYNYRVVMYKGDTRMDMRGQCSAGQKVLASLIIRLALAETFCLNCGILALDEPTTNLDRENIESLACALVDIIKSRAQNSSNFQLIVITHNIKFVEMIGKSDYVEHYFEVERDWNGLSILKKKNINGISE